MLKDHVTLFLRVPDTATSPKDPNCVKDLIFFLPISTFSIPWQSILALPICCVAKIVQIQPNNLHYQISSGICNHFCSTNHSSTHWSVPYSGLSCTLVQTNHQVPAKLNPPQKKGGKVTPEATKWEPSWAARWCPTLEAVSSLLALTSHCMWGGMFLICSLQLLEREQGEEEGGGWIKEEGGNWWR